MANILMETVNGINSIPVEDKLFEQRTLFMVDKVSAETTNAIIKQLMYLEQQDNTKEITLYINSPGGDVISGLAVYDFMNLMKSPIRTVCIGTAASMGAILFLAGDRREMLPHTRLMIHDPSYSHNDIGGCKPHEIQHELDKLNEVRKTLATIIATKTGREVSEIYKATSTDTYYNAQEAVDFGLATGIIESLENAS